MLGLICLIAQLMARASLNSTEPYCAWAQRKTNLSNVNYEKVKNI